MKDVSTIGLDLAKKIFQVHGVNQIVDPKAKSWDDDRVGAHNDAISSARTACGSLRPSVRGFCGGGS